MRSEIARKRWNGLALAFVLLGLTACGGGGGGGPSVPAVSAPSKVFVADAANFAIGSLAEPNLAPGVFTLDRLVAGPDTGLGTAGGTPSVSSIPSIAVDGAADRLYVATQGSTLVFDRIGTANGNVTRSRVIQSVSNNRAVNFFGLYITSNDVLYAVEPSGEVHAFNNAGALDGSVAPDRTVTPDIGAGIHSTFGVAVDTVRDLLYVGVVTSSSSIIVFKNAATANTAAGASLPPAQRLDFSLGVGSFCLDEERDILYAALDDGVILVFDKASELATGTPVPDRLMTLAVPTTTSASKQVFISVDATHNRLYAFNGTTGFIVNGASVADDAMLGAAQITVSSASSLFSAVAVRP